MCECESRANSANCSNSPPGLPRGTTHSIYKVDQTLSSPKSALKQGNAVIIHPDQVSELCSLPHPQITTTYPWDILTASHSPPEVRVAPLKPKPPPHSSPV